MRYKFGIKRARISGVINPNPLLRKSQTGHQSHREVHNLEGIKVGRNKYA